MVRRLAYQGLAGLQKWGPDLFFLLFLMLALSFREERLLADSGYYFFRVVNSGGFWIEHQRYVLLLSQILLLVGRWLLLPLSTLLVIWSLSHVLFFYALYRLIRSLGTLPHAGWLLLLVLFTPLRHGFFVPMFELYYAAALLLLWQALYRCPLALSGKVFLAGLAFLIFTSHPFALLLWLLMLLFPAPGSPGGKQDPMLLGLLLLALLSYLALKYFWASDYERAASKALQEALRQPDLRWSHLGNWLWFLLQHYYLLLLALLFALLGFIRQRAYRPLIWTPLLLCGFLWLIQAKYYGFAESRYQEQVYFPLSLLLWWLAYRAWPQWPLPAPLLLSLLLLISAFRISHTGKYYRGRLEEMQLAIARAQQAPGRKWIVAEADLHYPTNWSYPLESLIFSSLQGPSLSLATDEDWDYAARQGSLPKANEYLFRRYETYPLSQLDRRYWTLPAGPYQHLPPP